MKRILSLILAGMLLAISLAGCSLPAFAVWSLDPSEDAPTAPQFDEVLEEVFEGDHGSYTLCFAVSYPRRLKVFGRLPLPIYWKRCSMYQEDGIFSVTENLPTELRLPSHVNGFRVAELRNFSLRESLADAHVETLFLPDTVEKIASSALCLPKLKKLSIGRYAYSIDSHFCAFAPNLETIEVHRGNDWYTAPKSQCLYETKTDTLLLGTVHGYIPEGTKRIAMQAFASMTLHEQPLVLPDGLTALEWQVFFGTKGVTALILPDSLTEIGVNCFTDCSAERIEGGGYAVMPWLSFFAVSVTEFMPPPTLREVEEEAFWSKTLKTLYLPAAVETIEWSGIRVPADATVYCEAAGKPDGWDEEWILPLHDGDSLPTIVWGAEMPQ